MPKRLSKEEPLYEPIMNALRRVFACLGVCHLEVSARGFSRKMKKVFDDIALFMITVERFFPDITGFVKTEYSTDIITVEVKAEKPMIKDVFQAKDYAQVFNAKYVILVSPKAISEVRRRLILKRREIITRYARREPVVITRFDKDREEFEIDRELYYGNLPEPFKSHREALEAENLRIAAVAFGETPERTMDVSVENVGDVAVKIVEARLNELYLIQNVTIEPHKNALIDLSKEWSPEKNYKIELITKNGKKVSFEAEAPKEPPAGGIKKKWSEEEFFAKLEKDEPKAVEIIKNIYDWSNGKADRIWFGAGKEKGSFTFHYLKETKTISVFSIYTNGRLALNYGWLSKQVNKPTMEGFHRRMHEIPPLSHVSGDFSKWPSVRILTVFRDPKNLEKFKQAVIWLNDAIKT